MLTPPALLHFVAFAEQLKNTLRHSYTSRGRHESVAEHSWLLCLMALLSFDALALPVDRLKVLKMLIVHDLAEAITGDIPVFYKVQVAEQARLQEEAALHTMTAGLPPALADEIRALCQEFEARETPEARVAAALDKCEALIQHNLADVATWDRNDLDYQLDFNHPRNHLFDVDPFFRALKQAIDEESLAKSRSLNWPDEL
ncbi:MAG: HD domain-containing protein [Anaerolineae bacterium]|nr:HD domain-containing protein [Anaerolineae bacterium]